MGVMEVGGDAELSFFARSVASLRLLNAFTDVKSQDRPIADSSIISRYSAVFDYANGVVCCFIQKRITKLGFNKPNFTKQKLN